MAVATKEKTTAGKDAVKKTVAKHGRSRPDFTLQAVEKAITDHGYFNTAIVKTKEPKDTLVLTRKVDGIERAVPLMKDPKTGLLVFYIESDYNNVLSFYKYASKRNVRLVNQERLMHSFLHHLKLSEVFHLIDPNIILNEKCYRFSTKKDNGSPKLGKAMQDAKDSKADAKERLKTMIGD